MLEYHGWVTLRGNHDSSDEFQYGLVCSQALTLVSDRLGQIKANNQYIEILGQNGEVRLIVSGASNRKDSRWENVVKLYEDIAQWSSGSYGRLDFRDDEEPGEKGNSYQSYILKRGTLTLHVDPFLSPCIPEIEAPFVLE